MVFGISKFPKLESYFEFIDWEWQPTRNVLSLLSSQTASNVVWSARSSKDLKNVASNLLLWRCALQVGNFVTLTWHFFSDIIVTSYFLGRAHMEKHYADLKKKPFFKDLVDYMISGPVVCMVWEGLGAVKCGRMMLGETNPQASLPGSIRGDMSIQVSYHTTPVTCLGEIQWFWHFMCLNELIVQKNSEKYKKTGKSWHGEIRPIIRVFPFAL